MVATLIGKKEISSKKTNKDFTIAYIVFEDQETKGQACKDIFLDGHSLSDSLIGQEIEVNIGFNGRIQSVAPVQKKSA